MNNAQLAYFLSIAAILVAFGLRRRWLYGLFVCALFIAFLLPLGLVIGLPVEVISTVNAFIAVGTAFGVYEAIIRLVDRLASPKSE